jgi:hypothetical protein
MHVRLTPATVLSAAALFFALGGTAIAVSDASQPRCANGTVRGIADVTGEPSKGPANIPDQFSSAKALFARSYNCIGGGTQVRRVAFGVYDVRFPGNRALSAIVSSAAAQATVQAFPAGIFRVTLRVPGRDDEIDTQFVVVVV